MHSGGNIDPAAMRRSTITSYDRAIEFFNKGNIQLALKEFGQVYFEEALCQLKKVDQPNFKTIPAHELLFTTCQLIRYGLLIPDALDSENQDWIQNKRVPLKKEGIIISTYELANDEASKRSATEYVELYAGLDTAEKVCIYALALHQKNNLTKAKQIAGLFLNKFYHFMPNDIPNYLRESFIRMLIENVDGVSNIGHWKTMFLKDMDTVKEIKKQFLAVIDSLQDDGLKQLALWDCLCEDTFLGEVFHIKRGGRFPSITRKNNELNTVITMLSQLISKPGAMIRADNDFVRDKLLGNPEFMEDVKQFPAIEFVLKPRRNTNQPR